MDTSNKDNPFNTQSILNHKLGKHFNSIQPIDWNEFWSLWSYIIHHFSIIPKWPQNWNLIPKTWNIWDSGQKSIRNYDLVSLSNVNQEKAQKQSLKHKKINTGSNPQNRFSVYTHRYTHRSSVYIEDSVIIMRNQHIAKGN